MSEIYPDAHLTEDGIKIGDYLIPEQWIEGGSVKLRSERGFFHRVTLTVFVEGIHIGPGVDFTVGAP